MFYYYTVTILVPGMPQETNVGYNSNVCYELNQKIFSYDHLSQNILYLHPQTTILLLPSTDPHIII